MLIHINTDYIFSGAQSIYQESDRFDITDLYGESNYSGGAITYSNTVTLLTSIIEDEFQSTNRIWEWFLSHKDQCAGLAGPYSLACQALFCENNARLYCSKP